MINSFVINKSNLINNVMSVRTNNANSKICAMVKADAYGVGIENVVRLINDYVDYFGVSCYNEALIVKQNSTKPILIVGAFDKDHVNDCVKNNFILTCHSFDNVNSLLCINPKAKFHLKINTGMNRYGINCFSEFKKTINLIIKHGLIFEGIFTHFATNDDFVDIQFSKFKQYFEYALKHCPDILVHADESMVNISKNHHLNMVRIGFNLYNSNVNNFKSVVSINSKIVQINEIEKGEVVGYNKRFVANKNMKIAVIPIGYADGFDCALRGETIFFKSKPCKILDICMDCFMIDISEVKTELNDKIEILGFDNSLSFYANILKTSEYEIMTKFNNLRFDIVVT